MTLTIKEKRAINHTNIEIELDKRVGKQKNSSTTMYEDDNEGIKLYLHNICLILKVIPSIICMYK